VAVWIAAQIAALRHWQRARCRTAALHQSDLTLVSQPLCGIRAIRATFRATFSAGGVGLKMRATPCCGAASNQSVGDTIGGRKLGWPPTVLGGCGGLARTASDFKRFPAAECAHRGPGPMRYLASWPGLDFDWPGCRRSVDWTPVGRCGQMNKMGCHINECPPQAAPLLYSVSRDWRNWVNLTETGHALPPSASAPFHLRIDASKEFQARACNTLAFRAVARSATHRHRARRPAP